jgi:ribonuclease G
MSNTILANCSSSVNRVAVLENDRLVELGIEKPSDRGLMGNIFKGRVTNIVPGIQCAFVDIGMHKDLFLPLSDIHRDESTIVDPFEDDSPAAPILEDTLSEPAAETSTSISISELLKVGQEIVVQVVKEPIGSKGPRGTTYLTLPGRYVVLMPASHHLGISRRIEDPVEVARLQEIGLGIKPDGMGIIIRTVAQGRTAKELTDDIEFLLNLWDSIQKQQMTEPSPSLLHQESSLIMKVVRDIFSSKTGEFLIDSREEYERIISVYSFLPQELKSRIKFTDDPIFEQYGIEEEVHNALERKVPLPSGGTIVIEETEALVSIDVNTGSYIGKDNLEDTVFSTNIEAAKEVARQLRLRNLGGIIIIDFIDMNLKENRDKVYETLLEESKKDKTKYNIFPISELGILQMTRQRSGQSLSSYLLDKCVYCKGKGKISSRDYMTNKIYRELKKLCKSKHHSHVVLATCHPEVASILLEKDEYKFKQLEKETNTTIFIRGDSALHYEQYKFSRNN